MENFRWARRLSKSTISNVLECNPIEVDFFVNRKRNTILCRINTKEGKGWGLAICSCLDEFEPDKGKNISAGRAVLALHEKHNSRNVRNAWFQFPNTWTKKRIDHLKSFNGMPKCFYLPNEVNHDNMEASILHTVCAK